MFELKDNNQGQPASQPTPGQEQEGGAPAASYITLEQLNAVLAKQQAEFEKRTANLYRGMESLTTQAKTRLSELDNTLKQLQAAGQTIDPGVVQKLKTDIIAGAFNNEPQQPQAQPTFPGQERPTAPGANPIEQKIENFEAAFGIEILDDDPEVEHIVNISQGEDKFFASLRTALMAKQQRLASETPERAIARSPIVGSAGIPSSNPISGITDPSELWNLAMSKRKK